MITKVSVNDTVTTVKTAKNRQFFLAQNQSDADIYISFEGTSTITVDSGSTPGIRLAPGASFAADNGNNAWALLCNTIYAIHGSTGTKALVLHEG